MFDSIRHFLITRGLLERDWDPRLVKAIVREYVGLRAEANLGDAPTTERFEYGKGGRQGGVETPKVANELIQFALTPTVMGWRSKGWGFVMSNEGDVIPALPISHFVWADNLWLLSNCRKQLQAMIDEVVLVVWNTSKMKHESQISRGPIELPLFAAP